MPSNREAEQGDQVGAFSISVTPTGIRILTFTQHYGSIIIRTPDGKVWEYKDEKWEDYDADNQ